jgi:hypothetical protein
MAQVSMRRSLVMLFVALAISGCGGGDAKTDTLVGPVTSVRDGRVCVGGAAASGTCFVQNVATSDLKLNDCVRVTYSSRGSSGPSTATKVRHLDPAEHTAECPSR